MKTDLFINNEWRPATSGKRFPVVNPATEEVLGEVAAGDAADVGNAVRAAKACFESSAWRELSARKRGRLLFKTADLLEARLEEFARLESALAIERELQQQLFQSEDAKEGIAAYNEKRVAEFKGK